MLSHQQPRGPQCPGGPFPKGPLVPGTGQHTVDVHSEQSHTPCSQGDLVPVNTLSSYIIQASNGEGAGLARWEIMVPQPTTARAPMARLLPLPDCSPWPTQEPHTFLPPLKGPEEGAGFWQGRSKEDSSGRHCIRAGRRGLLTPPRLLGSLCTPCPHPGFSMRRQRTCVCPQGLIFWTEMSKSSLKPTA